MLGRNIKILGVLASVALLLLAYNNCGQKNIEFSQASKTKPQGEQLGDKDPQTEEETPPTEESNPPTEEEHDEAKEEIEDICEQNERQSETYSVTFEEPGRTCAFEKNDNLPRINDFFQARIEQTADLTLPEDSKVCDLEFSFPRQSFHFDDHFLFTFNGIVLASSYRFSSDLEQIDGLPIYEWSQIAGTPWDNRSNDEDVFCAKQAQGQSSCTWPETDTQGEIAMNFKPEIYHSIMALDPQRRHHSFQFITVGDNDDGDCEHSTVEFSVTVEYAQ